MKGVLLLFLVFLSVLINAQSNRTTIWLFGDSAGLDFSTTPPTPITGSKHWSLEGCATLCTDSGRLLYFMNHTGVYDSFGNLLKNGYLIGGDKSTTQVGLLLETENRNLFVRNIDQSALPGGGVDVFKGVGYDSFILDFYNQVYQSTEKVTAVRAVNGKGIFIAGVQHKTNNISTNYYDASNLFYCPKTFINGDNYNNTIGQLKFSPNGKILANTNFSKSTIEIYDFNNQTGTIQKRYFFKLSFRGSPTSFDRAYGLEFSPSSRFLYLTTSDHYLYQVDLNQATGQKALDSAIAIEKRPLPWGINPSMDQLQLAKDGKIYIAQHDSSYLCTIDSPDIKGTGCAYKLNSVYLGGNKSLYGLPNFNQSYFYTPAIDFTYQLNCSVNSISFKGKDSFMGTTFSYQIKDISGTLPTVYLNGKKDTSYLFLDTGSYNVTYIVGNGTVSDSVSKTIRVLPKIKPLYLGNDTFGCFPDSSLALYAPKGLFCYNWSTGSKTDTIVVRKTGTYICYTTDNNYCTVSDTIVICLDTNSSQPKINRTNNDLTIVGFNNYKASSIAWYKEGVKISTDSTIVLSAKGNYYAVIHQLGKCPLVSDTLMIDTVYYFPPPVAFTFTLNCNNHLFAANAQDTFNADTFYWTLTPPKSIPLLFDGKNIATTLADTGWYSLKVIAIKGNRKDSFTNTFYNLPKVNTNFLGNDTLICYPLSAYILSAPKDSFQYLWSTQESSPQISVKDSGSVWCKITGNNGCTYIDTVFIGIDSSKHHLKLAHLKDSLFCTNPPTTNNPLFHWFKNGSGLISTLNPKLTLKDTGTYYLLVTQDSLCPSYSDTLYVDTIYGVNNITQLSIPGLKIYPNPAQDYVQINWQGTENISLQWFDVLGKVVMEQSLAAKTNSTINIQQLAAGLYSIKANGVFVGKIVVE